MEEYHRSEQNEPPDHHLTGKHRRELEVGSGIAPEVMARRGYKTIDASEALCVGFSAEQAGSGLLIPLYSPAGEVSYQLKRDDSRVDKRGKPIKYEGRAKRDITLDVHPENHRRLLDSFANEPFIVTEGIKKADCASTHGRLTVGLGGTWMWGRKRKRGGARYGRPELLWDWDVIPLEGRTVYICFDADYREKQGVALAMLRLAERLTERGARVYIMNLPGPEKGLDDYLVAGGDLDELERDARPFTPGDLIRYAAKQDKRIHAVIASIAESMKTDDWTEPWCCTTHSLLRTFLELALLGGRYIRDEHAVEVMMGTRELRNYAAIGSKSTLSKHTAKLEERGYVKKVAGDRKRGRANRYILKLSKVVPVIEGGEGISIPGTPLDNFTPVTPLANFTPHLRWPGPQNAAPREDDPDSKLPRPEQSPTNFAHEKPDLQSIYEDGAASLLENPELEAPMGKTVEMALDMLLSWGGEASLRDLSAATGVNHTTKMRKKLATAGGVFDVDPKGSHGARVRITDVWRRLLDGRRERGGELRRSRQQAVRNRQSREMFRKPDDEPVVSEAEGGSPLAGPERMAEILKGVEERDRRARIEEQRRKVGVSAEVFLDDAMQGTSGFEWRELRALWVAKGGKAEELRLAVRAPYEFRNVGGLFCVVPTSTPMEDRDPAPVTPLREPRMPEKVDGIYHHDAFCDCDWCSEPIKPNYARSRDGK